MLKVARTLADLDGAESVGRIHLAEAISYRIVTDAWPKPRKAISGGVEPVLRSESEKQGLGGEHALEETVTRSSTDQDGLEATGG